MTVCETDRIPGSWVAACNQMTLIVVPSQWCYDAFVRSGVKTPIIVVNHGVDHVMTQSTARCDSDGPTFLHVSGSLSFAARKGTIPLLRAFKEFLKEYHSARLILKVPPTEGYQKALRMLEIEDAVSIVGEIIPDGMTSMLSSVDAVIQPSRAEGFGMIPLEAMCLGTPAIMTAVTGHAEYFDTETSIYIATGPDSRLETQANPVGAAPTVTANAILDAMNSFMRRREDAAYCAAAWAEQYSDGWKWENVLAPLARELKLRYSRTSITLGAKGSLRGV